MTILTLDTSQSVGVVGIGTDGTDDIVETEFSPIAERFSGALEGLFAKAGKRLEDVELFAVVEGPGSFTGLRMGVAAVKSLAHLCKKPAVGVSSLAAMAWTRWWKERGTASLVPVLPCGSRDFFYAVFTPNKKDGLECRSSERLAGFDEIIVAAPEDAEIFGVSIDALEKKGLLPKTTNNRLAFKGRLLPSHKAIAWLAKQSLEDGELLHMYSQPNYLKLSEPERKHKRLVDYAQTIDDKS